MFSADDVQRLARVVRLVVRVGERLQRPVRDVENSRDVERLAEALLVPPAELRDVAAHDVFLRDE